MDYMFFFADRNYETSGGKPCSLDDHLNYLRLYDGTPDCWDAHGGYTDQEIMEKAKTASIRHMLVVEASDYRVVGEVNRPLPSEILYRAIEDCKYINNDQKKWKIEWDVNEWLYPQKITPTTAMREPVSEANKCTICIAGAHALANAAGHEEHIQDFKGFLDLALGLINEVRSGYITEHTLLTIVPSLTSEKALDIEGRFNFRFDGDCIETSHLKGNFVKAMEELARRADWFKQRGL